jgi:hypothetical protein
MGRLANVKKMFSTTVTVSHAAQNNQHVANASETKSVKAQFVAAIPKPEVKFDTFKEERERNKKAFEVWDYSNPVFRKAAGEICDNFNHEAMQSIERKSVPFIEQWFGGYIKTKAFAELSDEKKEETLWLYESTKDFFETINDLAWQLKAGYYEPSAEEVLSPNFKPRNTRNTYPL